MAKFKSRHTIPSGIGRVISNVIKSKAFKGSLIDERDMLNISSAIIKYLGNSKDPVTFVKNLRARDKDSLAFLANDSAAAIISNHVRSKLLRERKRWIHSSDPDSKILKHGITLNIDSFIPSLELALKNSKTFGVFAALSGLGLKSLEDLAKTDNLKPDTGSTPRILEMLSGDVSMSKLKSRLGVLSLSTSVLISMSGKYKKSGTVSSADAKKDKDFTDLILENIEKLPDGIKRILLSSTKKNMHSSIALYAPHLIEKTSSNNTSMIKNLEKIWELLKHTRKIGSYAAIKIEEFEPSTKTLSSYHYTPTSIIEKIRSIIKASGAKKEEEIEKFVKMVASDKDVRDAVKDKDLVIGNLINVAFFRGARDIVLSAVEKELEGAKEKSELESWVKSGGPRKAFGNQKEMQKGIKLGFNFNAYLSDNPTLLAVFKERILDKLSASKKILPKSLESPKNEDLLDKVLGSYNKKDPVESHRHARETINKHLEIFKRANSSKVLGIIESMLGKMGVFSSHFSDSKAYESFVGAIFQSHLDERRLTYQASVWESFDTEKGKSEAFPEKLPEGGVKGRLEVDIGRHSSVRNIPELWGLIVKYRLQSKFPAGSSWRSFEGVYLKEIEKMNNSAAWMRSRSPIGVARVMEEFISLTSKPEFSHYRQFRLFAEEVRESALKPDVVEDSRDLSSHAGDRNEGPRRVREFDPAAKRRRERASIFAITKRAMEMDPLQDNLKWFTVKESFTNLKKMQAIRGKKITSGNEFYARYLSVVETLENDYIKKGWGDYINSSHFLEVLSRRWNESLDVYAHIQYRRIYRNKSWQDAQAMATQQMYSERYISMNTLFTSQSDETYSARNDPLTRKRRSLEQIEGAEIENAGRVSELESTHRMASEYATVPQLRREMGVSNVYEMLTKGASTPEEVDQVMAFVYEIIPQKHFRTVEQHNSPNPFYHEGTNYSSLEDLAAVRREQLKPEKADVQSLQQVADEQKAQMNTPGVTRA